MINLLERLRVCSLKEADKATKEVDIEQPALTNDDKTYMCPKCEKDFISNKNPDGTEMLCPEDNEKLVLKSTAKDRVNALANVDDKVLVNPENKPAKESKTNENQYYKALDLSIKYNDPKWNELRKVIRTAGIEFTRKVGDNDVVRLGVKIADVDKLAEVIKKAGLSSTVVKDDVDEKNVIDPDYSPPQKEAKIGKKWIPIQEYSDEARNILPLTPDIVPPEAGKGVKTTVVAADKRFRYDLAMTHSAKTPDGIEYKIVDIAEIGKNTQYAVEKIANGESRIIKGTDGKDFKSHIQAVNWAQSDAKSSFNAPPSSPTKTAAGLTKAIEAKIAESMSELWHETENISNEDWEIVMTAIDRGDVEDKLPDYSTMMGKLTTLPIAKQVDIGSVIKKSKGDEETPKMAGKGDIAELYIKYIILPVLKAKLGYDEDDDVNKYGSSDDMYGSTTESLYICNECCKTFRGKDSICLNCKSTKTERIIKEEEVKDQYKTLAKGVVDKMEADRIAAQRKGRVIQDEEDPKKFMVITKEAIKEGKFDNEYTDIYTAPTDADLVIMGVPDEADYELTSTRVDITYRIDIEYRSWGVKDIDIKIEKPVVLTYTIGKDEKTIEVPKETLEQSITWVSGSSLYPNRVNVTLDASGTIISANLEMVFVDKNLT